MDVKLQRMRMRVRNRESKDTFKSPSLWRKCGNKNLGFPHLEGKGEFKLFCSCRFFVVVISLFLGPIVFRGYSWMCTQESLLGDSENHIGIEPGSIHADQIP